MLTTHNTLVRLLNVTMSVLYTPTKFYQYSFKTFPAFVFIQGIKSMDPACYQIHNLLGRSDNQNQSPLNGSFEKTSGLKL